MPEYREICTFCLGETCFGIDAHCVQEVLRCQELTPLPLAAAGVRGLINLRGEIVTVIDLRTCLEMDPAGAGVPQFHLILQPVPGALSLLVDSVGEVVRVAEAAFEPPPVHFRGQARELIRGAYKLDVGLLLVLETERIANCILGGTSCVRS
jgi:purine-binding chemotaxis protein CheW